MPKSFNAAFTTVVISLCCVSTGYGQSTVSDKEKLEILRDIFSKNIWENEDTENDQTFELSTEGLLKIAKNKFPKKVGHYRLVLINPTDIAERPKFTYHVLSDWRRSQGRVYVILSSEYSDGCDSGRQFRFYKRRGRWAGKVIGEWATSC